MNKLFLVALTSLLLVACGSKDDAAKGAGAPAGKGGGGPGGKAQRVLNVEGYVAELSLQGKTFQTMATLVPKNSVSLSAATSGRLVSLTAKDGAIVKKGALLAKIDDSELRAQLKQAESNKMLAEQKEQRVRGLFEKNGATKQDLEAAEASLKSAQASVELIRAQLTKTEVRAPFNGKLGFVDVSVGAWLNSGTPIAELSEVDRLKAVFALPQRYASVIKVGDKITLKDSERNVEKDGVVSALDAVISESSRTRRVMVDVNNSKGELIAGSFVSVNVAMEASSVESFTIPSEAMILDREGAYVFVCQGGKAKIKHVTTGLRTPMSVQVLSGLAVGDTVIASGIVSLRPGADVKIKGLRHSINYEVE